MTNHPNLYKKMRYSSDVAGCFAADQTVAKVYYFIAFGLTVVVSWALRDYAENLLKHLPELETCFSSQVGI